MSLVKLLIFCLPALGWGLQVENFEGLVDIPKLVLSKKQIYFEEFPEAFNPSMIQVEDGYLLSFRYTPDRYSNPWLNYIGIVHLDEHFEPTSKPQLLSTRFKNSPIESQSEDARLFKYRGKIFLIYNDNIEVNHPSYTDRRDMFVAELKKSGEKYSLSPPIKLFYENKRQVLLQKNWSPWEYQGNLFLSYTVNPHEVLYLNLLDGTCYPCYETEFFNEWEFGVLRGSTPPVLVDGEYLAFFHSGIVTSSNASFGWEIWHYFMGAYTFSATPPFQITKMSPYPIISEEFYTPSSWEKRVIFPGGLFVLGDFIYVAYSKDDHEIWIAIIDKNALYTSLRNSP